MRRGPIFVNMLNWALYKRNYVAVVMQLFKITLNYTLQKSYTW